MGKRGETQSVKPRAGFVLSGIAVSPFSLPRHLPLPFSLSLLPVN